ncbi:MAG: DUF1850 domain-containing protein [Peptococcaceae bacterium]|jgi:hypothetical protein|nr:DUF1850 domain-containing protein [Peptococcaceae bacterium]MDH7525615.1 DUF1850 domain-containing protein [Peptococcaceae bacterium]
MSGLLFMKKVFIIPALIVLTIICFWPIYVLEVRVDGTEELVYQQPAKKGEIFDVAWTHSVTLQPVIETYKLEAPGRIPLVRMVFDDFGPNLPARPEFNQKWTISGGKYIVTNYDRYFERVPVVIGAITANHTLRYDGKEVRLKDVYRPGGYVHIGLVRTPPFQYLLKEVEIWLRNWLSNLQEK